MTKEEIKEAIEKLINLKNSSQLNEAKKFALELLKVSQISLEKESSALIYLILGNIFTNLSDYTKALENFKISLKINEEISNLEGIANSLGSIGMVYQILSNYPEALEYSQKSLKIHEYIDNKVGIANCLGNIGNIYYQLSDYTNALEHLFSALQKSEEIKINKNISTNLGNIGLVYEQLSDFTKSLEYHQKALHIAEDIGDKISIARHNSNIGIIYSSIGDYSKALEYQSKSLLIYENIENKLGMGKSYGNIGGIYTYISEFTKAMHYTEKALEIYEEIGYITGIAICMKSMGDIYNYLEEYNTAIEFYFKSLRIVNEIGSKALIASNYTNIGVAYSKLNDYIKALEYYNKSLIIFEEIADKDGIARNLANIGQVYGNKESSNFDISNAEEHIQKALSIAIEINSKDLIKLIYELLHDQRLNEERYKEALEYHKKSVILEKEIQSMEVKKQAERFDIERKTAEREKQLAVERAEAETVKRILHNILPVNIADRIIKHETFIADHFQSVSVLFMDLVGFTSLASIAPPKQLVYLLDAIFQKADEVVETFGLEKIKTIGDGYLAVANVTSPLEEHQKATALAALQLIETMRDFAVNIPSDLGDIEWINDMNDIEIRIGIHTGEVVAGIIGKNKYTYDLWGDAVNIASRMESNSEAGRIHISEEFAKSIEQNPEFSIIPRGEINIKGKGTMNTYWLEKAK